MSINLQNELASTCKNIMIEQPYYGLLLLNLQKEFTSVGIKTAGVGLQGINYKLLINPEFWETLSPSKRKGLIIHELQHIAFFHITEYDHLKQQDTANIAMDLEINQNISDEYLPDNGCTLDKYPDKGLLPHEGTNAYYKKLEKDESGDGAGGTGSMSQQVNQAKQDAKGTGQQPTTGSGTTTAKIPDHQWGQCADMNEAQVKMANKQLEVIMNQVAEQVRKSQGSIPSEIDAILKRLANIEPPKFNWKAYLRRYIGNSVRNSIKKTKRKQSRRFVEENGIRIQEFSHILIAIDSSASVSNNEILEFLNEIHHMYKSGHDFTLIFCDTKMQAPIKYKPNIDLPIKKRGGTDFNPVLDYYHQHKRKYSTLIYLTDGEANLPKKIAKNMLWVLSTISSDADHLKECGKVIKLN